MTSFLTFSLASLSNPSYDSSVCKPWKSLIRSPKFIALHLSHHDYSAEGSTTTTPSLLLHSVHIPTRENRLCLFSLSNLSSSRAAVDHSLFEMVRNMDVVGTHNGVICVSDILGTNNGPSGVGDFISLINPATKRALPIKLPPNRADPTVHGMNSLGFGLDPLTGSGCCKVISICSVKQWVEVQSEVFFYNWDLGSGKK